jgi:hypothetical protein
MKIIGEHCKGHCGPICINSIYECLKAAWTGSCQSVWPTIASFTKEPRFDCMKNLIWILEMKANMTVYCSAFQGDDTTRQPIYVIQTLNRGLPKHNPWIEVGATNALTKNVVERLRTAALIMLIGGLR